MATYDNSTSAWLNFHYAAFKHSGFPWMNAIFGIKPKWTPDNMASLPGKVVLVTGGNSGTGYETAKAYYEHGATVLLACRSEERALEAINDIKRGGSRDLQGKINYAAQPCKTPGEVIFIKLDLADLSSVEAGAQEILAKTSRLDVFFANAGIMAVPEGSFTQQGYVLQFGTNVLGHQRLFTLLRPLLQKSSTPEAPARVVLTSSFGHRFAPTGGIDYKALSRTDGRQLSPFAEYGMSKWGNVAMAKYITKHFGPDANPAAPILAFSLHPGMIVSNLANHLGMMQMLYSSPLMTRMNQVTPADGALNQIWAAELDTPEATKRSGEYISVYQAFVPSRPDTNDAAAVDEMWAWCDAQVAKAD